MIIRFFINGILLHELKLVQQMQPQMIGRGQANINFAEAVISQKHAVIFERGGKFYIQDNGSANGTYINNNRLIPGNAVELLPNANLYFASPQYKAHVTYEKNIAPAEKPNRSLLEAMGSKDTITIGRSRENDIILDDVQVSRSHVRIRRAGNQFWVKDLGSKNGTFINGKKISGEKEIKEGDLLLIGTIKLSLNRPAKDIRGETAIKIDNLEKIFPDGKYGFHEISCKIKSRTVVGIMGPSGCGKSTLLNVLTGNLAYDAGLILVHGLELKQNINYLKHHIGYVPQYDILHQELTVRDALWFTAKLRIENLEETEFLEKAMKILLRLHIEDVLQQPIHSLSGGQRKRVCIALELINDPLIIFLDEPTSPLDPQSAQELMLILNELVLTGTTVVMVTHKPDDIKYLNEVLFLGRRGWPLYYGNTQEYLSWFAVKYTVDIYSLANEPESAKFQELSGRYHSSVAASMRVTDNSVSSVKLVKKAFSPFWQLYWLVRRTIRIKLNDTGGIRLLLLQAPIIASLICIIFNSITLSVLFLLAISSIWLGVSNAAREIVGEANVYRRERMFNLGIGTYLFSKIFIFSLIGIVQSLLFTIIVGLRYAGTKPTWDAEIKIFFITFALNLVASLFGLMISATAKNNEQVVGIVPLLLIPQILLAGVLTRVTNIFVEILSYFTLSRWGTEAYTNAQYMINVPTPIKNQAGIFEVTNHVDTAKNKLISNYHQAYYTKDLFGSYTATPALEFIALSILSILFITGMVIAMRRKDIS